MELSRLYLIFKIFLCFIAVLIVEYLGCGIYFRFVRNSDFFRVDWICGLSAAGLCFLIFRGFIKSAREERIPLIVIALFFLFFSALLGCFLRFSLQLVNGWFDVSDPETHVVVVTAQKISPFGGSIKDGINPLAYMVYFHDWDDSLENCEMRVTHDFYYAIDPGTGLELAVRKGFFHWPWVEDYRVYTPPRLNRPQTSFPKRAYGQL